MNETREENAQNVENRMHFINLNVLSPNLAQIVGKKYKNRYK
jgi:hypothetical protein